MADVSAARQRQVSTVCAAHCARRRTLAQLLVHLFGVLLTLTRACLAPACSFAPRHIYSAGNFQSWSNVAARPEVLTRGTTHVAIGFVDLGDLAAACQVMPSSSSNEPLRWVGFEMSPYAVAKAMVVLAMMRQAADTDAILQVHEQGGQVLSLCYMLLLALPVPALHPL